MLPADQPLLGLFDAASWVKMVATQWNEPNCFLAALS
jgi:hypothetical protein